MLVDRHTLASLEVLQCCRTNCNSNGNTSTSAAHKNSLLATLDHTRTSVGSRLLRANMINPSTDIWTIQSRLDVVELLVVHHQHHPASLIDIGLTLKKYADVDKMLSGISIIPKVTTTKTAKFLIDTAIMLKHTIQVTHQLHSQLSCIQANSNSTLWNAVINNLSFTDMDIMLTHINEFICDTTTYTKSSLEMKHQECFAVKPGIYTLYIHFIDFI